MGSDAKLTPEEAALSLSKDLGHEPSISMVGVGREADGSPVLIVYAKSGNAARLKHLKEWKGYRIQIKHLAARPATSSPTSTSDPPSGNTEGASRSRPFAQIWTNPSVRKLMKIVGDADPVEAITHRARDVALEAMDRGWVGPPFDP